MHKEVREKANKQTIDIDTETGEVIDVEGVEVQGELAQPGILIMDIKVIASGSSGNCYRVSDGETSVLLDCGIPFKQIQKALNFELSSINGGVLVIMPTKTTLKGARELARIGVDVYTTQRHS